jgi:hypothetical protein
MYIMNRETLKKTSFRGGAGIKRTLLFCYLLFGLLLSGATQSQAQITGPSTVCSGVATVFNLTGTPNLTYTYNWSVAPAANATILSGSNTSGTIQWFNSVVSIDTIKVTINRPGLPDSIWKKIVTVYPQPNPQITTNTIVGCQGVIKGEKRDENGTIIDDGACIKVCAGATLQYNVVGGQAGSTFQWTVDPTKGTFSGPSTGLSVNVTWSSIIGFTFIKVKETTIAGCVKEKSICIQIIESPQAKFSVNGDITPIGPCFETCVGQLVQFADLTVVSLSSPIVSWQWDFGDGIYSSLQNPTHTYTSGGTYTVVLTVTNQCGCVGKYKVCIKVNNAGQVPLEIKCPSVVCENTIGHYTIANTCPGMVWTVNGGTIQSSTMSSIDILWDNVGASGFGEIIADFTSCGGMCGPKVTAQVPVILANGTISGKTTICYGKQYKYQLPKWPATNFKWTIIPASSGYIAGLDSNSHEVSIVGYSAFTLHCEYINTLVLCAGKADINVNVVNPLVLSAPEKACLGAATSIVTTIPAAGGTTYTFINPNGIVSGAGTFNMTGLWTVQAANPSFCEIEPISILVVDPPAAATSISGDIKVCLNTPYVYEIVSPAPNTVCNWTVSASGTILSNSGNSVTVQWNSLGVKTISVNRSWADLPGCSSASTSITITDAIPSVTISGNNTPCGNTSWGYTATLGAGSSALDNIVWSLSNTALGSVSAGQNTMTPTITWNNATAASTPCNLIATITKCGNTTTVSYPITVIGTPTVSVTVSNPTPCSGVPVTFTATTTPGGATVNWALTGGTPATATGASATTTFTNLGLASQNFTVIATASVAGCLLTGSASNTVAVKPQPNINVSPGAGSSSTILTCNPVNIPLLLSTNATTSINWYLSPSAIPIATGVTSYTATSFGTYRVDVTNSFGCSSSATRVIALDPGCSTCTPPAGAGANHTSAITSCANSLGQALVDVNFTSIFGTYYPSSTPPYAPGNILDLQVVGSLPPYCILPSISYSGFPNVPVNGIIITKPGIYPITLKIGYQQPSGTALCYKLVTENVIVPLITDFDHITNCSGGGYTLTLNDQTPILAGYTISSQSWNTTSSGGPTTTASSINLSLYTAGSTLNITHSVTVTGPAGTFTCTRTRTYVVPTVPTPSIGFSSTDPTSTAASPSSCAGREVLFTSLINTGVTKWSWNFGDSPTPTSFISNTLPTATRTYDNPAASYNPIVTLTLNDAFGCTFSTTKQFNLYKNTFVLNSSSTYTLGTEIKCEGTSSSILLTGVSGGYGSNTYVWSREDLLLPYTSNPVNVTQNGLYWTKVTDLHGCQVAANPTPAKRAFQPLPDVAIFGSHDYCPFQPIKLNAVNGTTTGITYQWQQLIGAVWTNIPGATAGIYNNPSGSIAGVYQFRVTASQNLPSPYSGACLVVSPAFTVTVHAEPNYPAIASPIAVNCANYSIQLGVISPQVGVTYNWSNGALGTPTIVNHGGAYRVWATNIWGCKSHADVDVPLEPASYFWRFPHGCYTFCPDQLPRQIDGPSFVTFTAWKWYLSASGLPYPNGSWASSGSGSTVDPLNINADPTMGGDGNGSGDYSWYLDNGLCAQTSDPMSIDILKNCCKADAKLKYFKCIVSPDGTGSTYYGGIDVYGAADCPSATYTIYALDPVTGLPNGIVTPVSGPYTPGTTIAFSYTPFAGVTSVKFQVVIECDGKPCIATLDKINLEEYDCSDMEDCRTEHKWEYFKCVWPKGYSSPYFIGGVYVNNPFGCDATSYIITAVDPVTGLPNGSISPASGTISSGWVPVYFTYTPAPGVTAVKFRITLICDGRICTLELGEFKGLDDKDKYPCTDHGAYAKKVQGDEDQSLMAKNARTTMLIAPNPANNNVQISYTIPNRKDGELYQISIINLLGQTVAQYNVTNSKGAWQYSTLQLNAGTYLVRFVKDGRNIDVQNMLIVH